MSNAQKMVAVTYRGFFDDGHTFIDQTKDRIVFPCIDGFMPPAFIETVRDMVVGETRIARVEASEAYEQRRDDRILHVARTSIPASIELATGMLLELEQPDGTSFCGRLIELTDDEAVFDANHDVTCKALNFEITLLETKPFER